ncbi:type II toxin-antitoxin system Phd/YefM family antitoxin [Peptococcaceae bacterium 1198_IL3148]
MPKIRPISDLRNNFNKISEICHQEQQPVFITKNGEGNLVVMSMALYEKQQSLIKLYEKLAEAEAESRAGEETTSHQKLMAELRKKYHE